MTFVDTLTAGSGPAVVLVHSSVAGVRQWRRLVGDLEGRFHVIAPNLFGYGRTPPWEGPEPQTLADQAGLITASLAGVAKGIRLVGHSFGGSVAMKAAEMLGPRVDRLILLEPNPFYLLRQHGRWDAYAEAVDLRDWIKACGAAGEWVKAAERFADYWGGEGSWASMPDERRVAFAEALKPNFHEWDAVMNETTTLDEWKAGLPANTVVLSSASTVRPIRDIVALLRENCPGWRFEDIAAGGHMAPLTRPDLVNPLVGSLLQAD